MATDSMQTGPTHAEWADDEIDLRRYLSVIGHRWVEIVLVAALVVAVVVAAIIVYRVATPPTYEAVATAAIVRTSTDVNFDERFTTTADQTSGLDNVSRRASLAGLVNSGAIAQQVIAQLGDMLATDEQDPAFLLEMVTGEIGGLDGRPGQSDLITIKVTADSPEKAAAIANAWAAAYVQEVNRIYGQVPDEMLASVQTELSLAEGVYAVAQGNVEAFVASSQLESLQRQEGEKQQTIDALEQSKLGALETYVGELEASYQRIVAAYLGAQTSNQLLAFDKEQEGQRALLTSYLDAYNTARVDTFTAQSDRDRAELRLLYDQWLQTTAHLATARTLATQLEAAGEGAVEGTSLALQLLKLQVVSDGGRLPVAMGDLYQTAGQLANPAPAAPGLESLMKPIDGSQGQQSASVNQVVVGGTTIPRTVDGASSAIQLQLSPTVADATLDSLNADVTGMVQSLEQRLSDTEQAIAALEQALLAGNSFAGLGEGVPDTSELAKAIQEQYPQLFQSGGFSAMSVTAAADTTLASAGRQQAANLLALAGPDALPTFNGIDAPMVQAIDQLESDVRTIRAQLEAERARDLQTKQQRDLSWESYKALSNKLAELNLARAAGNSEVRMGISAVPPNEPIQGVSLLLSLLLAAVIGLVLALIVAFVREYMNRPPLFARRQPASTGSKR